MVESLSNNADKSDVDAEVEDHRATDVHDEPQPPEGKGEAGGVAELDDNGTVRSGQVPSLAVTDTFTVENETDLTSLSDAEIGDVGIVSSDSLTYILTGDYDVQDDWVEFETPPAPVDDVNGQTGSVDLGAGDVDAEPSGAVEDHRTGETHTTAQPPENHGNGAHNVTFAEDGDAQPPESHGNGAHNVTFAEDGDAQPPESHGNGAHTAEYTTLTEVNNNADVPDADYADNAGTADSLSGKNVETVNGKSGAVSVPDTYAAPEHTFYPSTSDVQDSDNYDVSSTSYQDSGFSISVSLSGLQSIKVEVAVTSPDSGFEQSWRLVDDSDETVLASDTFEDGTKTIYIDATQITDTTLKTQLKMNSGGDGEYTARQEDINYWEPITSDDVL